jgi:hypothetical protein
MIPVISDAYSHMPLDMIGNGKRDSEAQYSMRDTERVDVPVAPKKFAREPSGNQTHGKQHRIGYVHETEND